MNTSVSVYQLETWNNTLFCLFWFHTLLQFAASRFKNYPFLYQPKFSNLTEIFEYNLEIRSKFC